MREIKCPHYESGKCRLLSRICGPEQSAIDPSDCAACLAENQGMPPTAARPTSVLRGLAQSRLNAGKPPTTAKPCIHRGDVVREDKCDLCGIKGQPLPVLACSLHGECSLNSAKRGLRACSTCDDRASPGQSVMQLARYEPWSHRATVAIPHLDTPDALDLCVRAWLSQSERPYILVVDTGSRLDSSRRCLDDLAATDGIEVARLGISSRTEHSSDRVAIALDYAHARCPTEYLIHTHSDAVPTRRDVLHDLLHMCSSARPIVGWEMSPRGDGGELSRGCPGHVLLCCHQPTIDRLNLGWSIRRGDNRHGLGRRPSSVPGWPDTESGIGRDMAANAVAPHWCGREANAENQENDWFLHYRSYTGWLQGGRLDQRHATGLARAREIVGRLEAEAANTNS